MGDDLKLNCCEEMTNKLIGVFRNHHRIAHKNQMREGAVIGFHEMFHSVVIYVYPHCLEVCGNSITKQMGKEYGEYGYGQNFFVREVGSGAYIWMKN